MATKITPFGLTFAEPTGRMHPRPDATGATLCRQQQVAVFNGRPLCELMATEMAESVPTEKDGKDPINVDSDPFTTDRRWRSVACSASTSPDRAGRSHR
jgi:putative ATP-grasp target RiPP